MSWTLALISPRDFSPFTQKSAPIQMPGPAALSLLICGRSSDYSSYVRNLEGQPKSLPVFVEPDEAPVKVASTPSQRLVLAVASRLPFFEATSEDADSLRQSLRVIDDPDLQCAATLVAALSYCQNDMLPEAISVCQSTVTELHQDPFLSAVLHLQISLRQLSVHDYQRASDSAQLAIDSLASLGASPVFSSTSSAELAEKVQIGLGSAARDNYAAAAPRARGGLGVAYSSDELNFGRFWVEKDIFLEEGATDYIKEVFDQTISRVSTNARTVRFGGGDKVDRKLSVHQLLSEVSGHWRRARDSGAVVGRAKIARANGDADEIARGLQLLRLYEQERALKDAIRTVAAQGPVESLQKEIQAAIQSLEAREISRTALTVVRMSAEYMDEAQRTTALASLTEGWWPESQIDGAGWYRAAEPIISTLDVLLELSAQPGPALSFLRPQLSEFDAVSAQQMAGLVRDVQWGLVPEDELRAWSLWSADNLSGDTEPLALNVLVGQARHGAKDPLFIIERRFLGAPSPSLAAALLDLVSFITDSQASALRPALTATCVSGLDAMRKEAQGHSYGFGGQDIGILTAAAAAYFSSDELWNSLTDFLTDPLVAPSHKSRALEWMAFHIQKVPSAAVEELVQNQDLLVRGAGADLFGDLGDRSAAVFRFMCAAGGISFERSLVDYLGLAADRESINRAEAARSAPYVAQRSSPDVVVPVLLRLASDEASTVRVAANSALVRLALSIEDPLRGLTYRALESALSSDGSAGAIAVLSSIQAELANESREVARMLELPLRDTSTHHASARVRARAKLILDDLAHTPY